MRSTLTPAQPPVEKKDDKSLPIGALRPRLVGPAVTSGRVVGFAVHPHDRSHFFAAAASGGVWKTANGGTTWTPVFDGEGSYSIGCLALDPKNPSTVWVGTGENNSQRSVGYGDGVYKTTDGGKSWTNVGLKTSEHIGKIVIDPRDSDTVYVAAQGPLWNSRRRTRTLQDHRRRQDLDRVSSPSTTTPASPTWSSIRAGPTC